jgi:hypothetical protein
MAKKPAPIPTVTVSKKSAFGREMYQAMDDTALLFVELVGQKNNLTLEQLKIIKKLGFEVKFEQEEI